MEFVLGIGCFMLLIVAVFLNECRREKTHVCRGCGYKGPLEANPEAKILSTLSLFFMPTAELGKKCPKCGSSDIAEDKP
jgi:predicted RNA-binding Zn-ribbon protein involved in translation (DUF1610 family)